MNVTCYHKLKDTRLTCYHKFKDSLSRIETSSVICEWAVSCHLSSLHYDGVPTHHANHTTGRSA